MSKGRKKNKNNGDARFAIKLATLGVSGSAVLDHELLQCICSTLEGAESPECQLEYLVDDIVVEGNINTDSILQDIVINSYEATGKKRKIFEASRGEWGRLCVNYMELTRKEAEELLEKLKF